MKLANKRVRLEGTRFQLGVILHPDEPGMVGNSTVSGSNPSGETPAKLHALGFQLVAVAHVDLVAVAVPLGDFGVAIDLGDAAAVRKLGLVRAEPHRAAEIAASRAHFELVAAHPLGHQANDRLVAGAEFGGIGVLDAGQRAGGLDHRHLHAEADAEIRHLALAGEARRADLAFRAAVAEAAGHQDAVDMLQERGRDPRSRTPRTRSSRA